MSEEEVLARVAWAVHAWSCPLCFSNGMPAMAESGEYHVTAGDRLMAAFLVGALGLVHEKSWHGTRSGYIHHKCRCPPCTAAQSVAVRQWRAKRKASTPTPSTD